MTSTTLFHKAKLFANLNVSFSFTVISEVLALNGTHCFNHNHIHRTLSLECTVQFSDRTRNIYIKTVSLVDVSKTNLVIVHDGCKLWLHGFHNIFEQELFNLLAAVVRQITNMDAPPHFRKAQKAVVILVVVWCLCDGN